jgi:hypothetical protein
MTTHSGETNLDMVKTAMVASNFVEGELPASMPGGTECYVKARFLERTTPLSLTRTSISIVIYSYPQEMIW